MKHLIIIILLIGFCPPIGSQTNDCNKLGVWLWYLNLTEYETHEALAQRLSDLGAKRIFIKVSDGSIDSSWWPEIVDKSVPKVYRDNGIEPWAWSFNYPGNFAKQAEALSVAMKTGYHGYVVDVESHFDGDFSNTNQLFSYFYNARQLGLQNLGLDSFPMYCTTWGNAKDHDFYIETIDQYVDGFMPQVYVEQWGGSILNDIPYWVNYYKNEYVEIGATKPVHPIVATQDDVLTADDLNDFILEAGAEASLWRIPGGGVPLQIWEDWEGVDWDIDFCIPSSTHSSQSIFHTTVFPNPTFGNLTIFSDRQIQKVTLKNQLGESLLFSKNNANIDLQHLPIGYYLLEVVYKEGIDLIPIIKQ